MQQGTINVQTENIFPIIKKFLYSDQDIFLRELISNAIDATQKLRVLASKGDVKGDIGTPRIEVKVDKDNKTITISDQGIGMTSEEVIKYITEIAFSSAEEFIEKFKGVDDKAQIIGHFGLGFYSAFMVAEKVELVTQSFKDAPAVKWTCDGSTEYTLEETTKEGRGTDVILHVTDEAKEFLDEWKIRELLEKYCKFLPVPIKFGEEEYEEKEGEESVKKTRDRIINTTDPAWVKEPSKLKDEDYLAFYKQLYPMSEDPLFWIHLNVDYPFNLTGILYFPKLKKSYEVQKNKIGLYSNQVFVTDNVEEIVPEFLTLLHGVIDSPDIPLNVSRSYLQSDSNVKKITGHISKKVSDKLTSLFKKDRKAYEGKWESIGVFVKYGLISDEKFYDRTKDACLLPTTDGAFYTLSELKEAVKSTQVDKNGKTVLLYTNDDEGQHAYIQAAEARGYKVVAMDIMIDNHFMQHIEMKDTDISFKRVDADTLDKLIEKDETVESVLSKEEEEKLKTVFDETINDKNVTVELKPLSPTDYPVMITQNEFMRRMKEMSKMGGGMPFMGDMPESITLVVNTNHELSQKILKAKAKKTQLIQQLFDLALLSQGMLRGKKLTEFIERSVEVM